jgi:hypothetical protein
LPTIGRYTPQFARLISSVVYVHAGGKWFLFGILRIGVEARPMQEVLTERAQQTRVRHYERSGKGDPGACIWKWPR